MVDRATSSDQSRDLDARGIDPATHHGAGRARRGDHRIGRCGSGVLLPRSVDCGQGQHDVVPQHRCAHGSGLRGGRIRTPRRLVGATFPRRHLQRALDCWSPRHRKHIRRSPPRATKELRFQERPTRSTARGRRRNHRIRGARSTPPVQQWRLPYVDFLVVVLHHRGKFRSHQNQVRQLDLRRRRQ